MAPGRSQRASDARLSQAEARDNASCASCGSSIPNGRFQTVPYLFSTLKLFVTLNTPLTLFA
jgi:RNA polymerase-binding transcription factor DksA